MDLLLPGQSGQAAAAAIRRLSGPDATLPIIALTAQVDAADEEGTERAVFDGVMSKPAPLWTLLEEIGRRVWYREQAAQQAARPPAPPGDVAAHAPILAADRLQE